MHIDGALGASYLLAQEDEPFKSLCMGMNLADSLSWNLHKLLGVPLQCSVLLTKHPGGVKDKKGSNDALIHAYIYK